MPDINEQEKVARKLLPIIYVLDTSGSMSGAPIAAVNNAMTETLEVLKDVSRNNPTAELKIGVIQFASGAEWITKDGFVYMDDFYWNDLKAGGLTDFGSALSALNDKLSRKEYMDSEVGYKVPVIVFMSDGEPTDDWESALQKITNGNKWFKIATKIGIAVGDSANTEVMKKIVGNGEAVIKVDDLETLKKLIKVVSVTASKIGSQSRTDSNATSDIIDGIKDNMEGKVVTADEEIPDRDVMDDELEPTTDNMTGTDIWKTDSDSGIWD